MFLNECLWQGKVCIGCDRIESSCCTSQPSGRRRRKHSLSQHHEDLLLAWVSFPWNDNENNKEQITFLELSILPFWKFERGIPFFYSEWVPTKIIVQAIFKKASSLFLRRLPLELEMTFVGLYQPDASKCEARMASLCQIKIIVLLDFLREWRSFIREFLFFFFFLLFNQETVIP